MQSNLKRHPKQTALPLLRVNVTERFTGSLSKMQWLPLYRLHGANSAVFIADMHVNAKIWRQCLRVSQPLSGNDDKKGESCLLHFWIYNHTTDTTNPFPKWKRSQHSDWSPLASSSISWFGTSCRRPNAAMSDITPVPESSSWFCW